MSMREQPLYIEDWIGLRTLDESGRVVLVSCDAEHMRLLAECWQPLVENREISWLTLVTLHDIVFYAVFVVYLGLPPHAVNRTVQLP